MPTPEIVVVPPAVELTIAVTVVAVPSGSMLLATKFGEVVAVVASSIIEPIDSLP